MFFLGKSISIVAFMGFAGLLSPANHTSSKPIFVLVSKRKTIPLPASEIVQRAPSRGHLAYLSTTTTAQNLPPLAPSRPSVATSTVLSTTTTKAPQIAVNRVTAPVSGFPDTVAGAQALIRSLPWPVETALEIEQCESSLNPNALSGEGAKGLMQEMGGTFDPLQNIRDAYSLWQSRGFEPWYSSQSCWGNK